MPLGTRYEVIGVLIRSELGLAQRAGPCPEVDGGGTWRLEVPWRRTSHLIDERVRVSGTRVDFDVLVASSITPLFAS